LALLQPLVDEEEGYLDEGCLVEQGLDDYGSLG
jgi:hypothetical protein